jgi:hypothetical protein
LAPERSAWILSFSSVRDDSTGSGSGFACRIVFNTLLRKIVWQRGTLCHPIERGYQLTTDAPLLLSHSACRLPKLNVSQYFLIGCQPRITFLFLLYFQHGFSKINRERFFSIHAALLPLSGPGRNDPHENG